MLQGIIVALNPSLTNCEFYGVGKALDLKHGFSRLNEAVLKQQKKARDYKRNAKSKMIIYNLKTRDMYGKHSMNIS